MLTQEFNGELTADQFDLAVHNGTITIESLQTGDHRTFQIHTVPEFERDATGGYKLDEQGQKIPRAMAGKRIISLLIGPDNEGDFQGFGFVEGSEIVIWRKKYGPQTAAFRKMFRRLTSHVANGKINVHIAGTCRKCNRKLTVPESITTGLGPICAGRK